MTVGKQYKYRDKILFLLEPPSAHSFSLQKLEGLRVNRIVTEFMLPFPEGANRVHLLFDMNVVTNVEIRDSCRDSQLSRSRSKLFSPTNITLDSTLIVTSSGITRLMEEQTVCLYKPSLFHMFRIMDCF